MWDAQLRLKDGSAALVGSLWAAVFAVLAVIAVLWARYVVDAIGFPYSLDYSEGLVWQQALWLFGPHSYGDISHYPFVVFEYPPLYLLGVRALAWFGLGMLPAGRLISVLSTGAACLLIGLIVRRLCSLSFSRRASNCAAVIAALLPLSLLPVSSWAPLMRVDMLALGLAYCGIAFGVWSFRRPGLIYAAVLAFVAAAFTKQIYLAGAVAMFAVSVARAPVATIKAYAAGAVLGIVVLGVMDWLTAGGFLRHILSYNVDTLDLSVAARQAGTWLLAYGLFAVVTLVAVAVFWMDFGRRDLLARTRNDELHALLAFLSLYLLLTTIMLVSAGKTGASRNYFIEWMCAWCLWIGWLAGWCIDRLNHPLHGRSAVLPILMPLLLVLQCWMIPGAVAGMRDGQMSSARRATDLALLQRVKALKGPLLSDDMVLVIESGREVGLEPGILLELAHTGLWDEQHLIDMLNNHEFAAIVTAYGPGDPTFDARYLPRTQTAMLADYPVVERFGDYRLRLPR